MLLTVVGWVGAAVVVGAYGMVSLGLVPVGSSVNQVLNVAGGALLTGNALCQGALPSAVSNLVWIALGTYALAQSRRRRHAPTCTQVPSREDEGSLQGNEPMHEDAATLVVVPERLPESLSA